jgi:hypothetical protein
LRKERASPDGLANGSYPSFAAVSADRATQRLRQKRRSVLGGSRRHRRDRKRQPCVPPGRPVAGVEFAVSFEVHVALHPGDGEEIADLRADPDDARLERSELRARSAVAGQLVIDISYRADLKARRQELRRAPVEMRVDAVLVLRGRIDEIVGRADDGGKFVSGLRIEIGVAAAGVDGAMPRSRRANGLSI